MELRDVIVVGCGIVGATVAKLLGARGLNVLVLDDARPGAGTPPSGGHLRPGWFRGMKESEYEPAMDLLDEAWGLRREEFVVRSLSGGTTLATVHRVDTDAVVRYATNAERATVIGLGHLDNYPIVRLGDGRRERCRLLVVAAGVWSGNLVSGVHVYPKQGVSFRLAGSVEQPLIEPWAPYKQVVVHQQSPGELWAGDGSSLKPENWTGQRTEECLARCAKAAGLDHSPEVLRVLHGHRPYAAPERPGEPCLLRRLGPRAWLVTGAGKLGTIAAGWAADIILKER